MYSIRNTLMNIFFKYSNAYLKRFTIGVPISFIMNLAVSDSGVMVRTRIHNNRFDTVII